MYSFIYPVMSNIMPDNTPTLLFGRVNKDPFGLNIQLETETLLTYYTLRVKYLPNIKT